MSTFLLKMVLKIRWWYFHINPNFIKFYMDSSRSEAHFQHIKTGELHCNYAVVEQDT